jgi:peptidyl-tRNA hydrolase, PTH1 family
MEATESKNVPFLVVGLGNPGPEYANTPHNAGFLAVDRIAEQAGVAFKNRRCRALTATCFIAGREVILAKPETFMNLSGGSVAALVQEFEANPERDLAVLYDELDLPFGTVKIKERGSAAGHNGARSIINALESQDWLRIRIGVGLNLPPEAVETRGGKRLGRDYLLSPLRKSDLTTLDEVLDRVAQAVRTIVEVGPAAAMNEFNRREQTGPPTDE